jgi:hypothetical protein
MYTKRNAIYLLIALVVTLFAGLFFSNRVKAKHAEVVQKHEKLKLEFTESDKIAKTLPEVQVMYDSLKKRWLDAPKKILSLPEPQLTVSYMVWLADHYNLDMEFEFKIDKIKQLDIISQFTFSVTGITDYDDLYTFIFYMTQNPILYKFEKINLRRNEENKIEYEIQMMGFFLHQDILPGEQFNFAHQQAIDVEGEFFDIFYTTYQPPVDPAFADAGQFDSSNEDDLKIKSNLVDPSQASLLALTSSTAYVLNDDGVMKRLSPGSQVYGGQLLYIDQERSEALFQLHGGERVTLGLGYKR